MKPSFLKVEGNNISFYCAGCKHMHHIQVGEGPGPRWSWNNDLNSPTFQPSILETYEHWTPPYIFGHPKPETQVKVTDICHTFVTDGKIQYLSDCTHHLANQTVDMLPWNNNDVVWG